MFVLLSIIYFIMLTDETLQTHTDSLIECVTNIRKDNKIINQANHHQEGHNPWYPS